MNLLISIPAASWEPEAAVVAVLGVLFSEFHRILYVWDSQLFDPCDFTLFLPMLFGEMSVFTSAFTNVRIQSLLTSMIHIGQGSMSPCIPFRKFAAW